MNYILFLILPKVLNRLANDPQAWDYALEGVRRVFANKLTGKDAQDFFGQYVAPVLDYSKHPTRTENFLREAALYHHGLKTR